MSSGPSIRQRPPSARRFPGTLASRSRMRLGRRVSGDRGGGATAASAQAPRLTVIGVGAGVTCAEWVADARADRQIEQWAFGFASAVAAGAQLRRGDDPLAGMDADAIHAWLGDYCRRRLDDALSVALVRMVYAGLR